MRPCCSQKGDQLRHARHGAVLIHDFADDSAGFELGQAGQIDGGLGLSGANQHAAFAGAQGEDVARAGEVARTAGGPDGGADGVGAVGRGDSGGDALGGVDGFAEGGAEARGVHGRDQGQMQGIATLRRQRQADQAAPMHGHEVDRLGRNELGGQGQVALVFAVFVVDHHQHAAGADFLDGLGNGGKWHASISG